MKSPMFESCAIVGIGETRYGRLPGVSLLGMKLEAAKKAIEDAGLTNRDIDGLLVNDGDPPEHMYSCLVAENLGIPDLKYTTPMQIAGATGAIEVIHAVAAITAGLAETVVCIVGSKGQTGREVRKHGRIAMGGEDWEDPFGVWGAPARYAMATRRHMMEYGTTSRQLGAIAVAMRKHAGLNDNATMRTPITVEDHQNSRWIVEPFHLLDVCLISDAAAAVVITTAEKARSLRHPPITILGVGEGYGPNPRHWINKEHITESGAKYAGQRAFAMAGVTPADIDVAEIYD